MPRNNPEAEKKFYEALSGLVDGTDTADQLAEILLTMMGLEWNAKRGWYQRNPDHQAAADQIARRWLKDNGYMER